jgi:hypothetical protein
MTEAIPQIPTTYAAPDPWTWILRNATTIRRLCARFGHFAIEPKELEAEVLLDLAEEFERFDPKRGGPSTWIFWRINRVRSRLLRDMYKDPSRRPENAEAPENYRVDVEAAGEVAGVLVDFDDEPHKEGTRDNRMDAMSARGWGSPGRMEAETLLGEVLAAATPAQRIAAETFYVGLDPDEIRARTGAGRTNRNARLRALRRNLQEDS